VVSEWNYSVTGNLLRGTYDTLLKFGVESEDIIVEHVPGSFELTYGAKLLIEKANLDSVIILGCVIQGETPHFTFVCESVTQGSTQLNLDYNVPVIFGLLTTNTLDQAKARSGGRHGNKGDEAAITALKMIALHSKYQ
jgi:6,7-dimethyl-8-ribityllumazine synthase